MARATGRSAASRTSHLQLYLRDVNETPLLSAEQERALAEQVAAGDPEARDHMVRANLRLVVNIARSYLGKGLSLDDLIEEGNLGLLRAVEGFDAGMATRFSTYASFWIKQAMRRAVLNQGKPIRLPAYMVTLLAKWRRANASLTDQLGRPPTLEEVGQALGLSKRKLAILARAVEVHQVTLHTASSGDEWSLLDELPADDHGKPAEEQLVEADDLRRVLERLDRLDDREATVVRMRFGLPPYDPMTLREVGQRLGLTRERVRQLESLALSRLVGRGA
jgi:RNA polymerase primary sigma factor